MKTVIIKWNPLYSEVSMFDLWSDIRHLSCGTFCGENEKRWPIAHQHQVSLGDQFFIVKLGYGPQGIIGHGIISRNPLTKRKETGLEPDTYYAGVEFSTLINPATLPILTIEELQDAVPTYDWTSGICDILTELEASQLVKKWQQYISQNRDIFLQYNINRDSVYRNDFLTCEEDIDYSPKAILIKWNPNTSNLSLKRFFDNWGELHCSDNVIPWPLTTPQIFSRHDRVYVTVVGTDQSGLLLRGNILTSPQIDMDDFSTWVYLRVRSSMIIGRGNLRDVKLTYDEITELLPQVSKDANNEEIPLTSDDEKRLLETLYSKSPDKFSVTPPLDYFLATDLPF